MSQVGQARATLADLYRTPGKAELIGGRIVQQMATGRAPNRGAFRITRSLDDHAQKTGKGEAYTRNMGFAIPELASGRESFSPDASYYDGPMPANRMRFIEGPPKFAAEVRSENDYGDAAEAEMADKRADYFAAGTLVVWDVDPLAECIHVYRSTIPPIQQRIVEARSPKQSRPCLAGGSRWIGFSASRLVSTGVLKGPRSQPGSERFLAAIEGKGPKDPLDRPFAGRRMSAADQGYRYAINLPCDWIIVTSMRETRLYHKNSDQHTCKRSTPRPCHQPPQKLANWHTHFFRRHNCALRQELRLQLSLPTVASSFGNVANSIVI